jgi:hypothetical protein
MGCSGSKPAALPSIDAAGVGLETEEATTKDSEKVVEYSWDDPRLGRSSYAELPEQNVDVVQSAQAEEGEQEDATSPASPGGDRFQSRFLRGKSARRQSAVLTQIGSLLDSESPSETAAHLLFRFYDRDADGKLNHEECTNMLREYGFAEDQAILLRGLLDSGADGKVEFASFWRWLNSANRHGQVRALGDSAKLSYLQSAAQMFHGAAATPGSAEGAGRIHRDELGALLQGWGEEDVEGALDEMAGYQNLTLDSVADEVGGVERARGGGGAGYISLQSFVKYLSQFDDWQALNTFRASVVADE